MNVSTEQMNTVIAHIMGMDSEQISSVVDAVKLRRNRCATQSIRSIEVGSTVKFVGRRGVTVTGTVLKKKIKNCVVETLQGSQRWNVPASMLEVV
jgi:hypothetical protein